MGLFKRQMEEDEERGRSSGGDKHVCVEHVEDEALKSLIAEHASATPCSYCGRGGTQLEGRPGIPSILAFACSASTRRKSVVEGVAGYDPTVMATRNDMQRRVSVLTAELDGET